MREAESQIPPALPTGIDAVFRNGSLTGVSVILGFSLSFLTRWAGFPGTWQTLDLVALSVIVLGVASQTVALACLLSIRSLQIAFYRKTLRAFLIGLILVSLGIALAIAGDLQGYGQRVLG